MGQTIEREIVQMQFDGKEFKSGIQDSLRDLEMFKKSFDFKNAQDSVAKLEQASRIDFSGMEKAISSINSKVSILGVAAAAVITKVTGAVIDGTKKLFDTLVLGPVLTGLQEYETQLNAVQTILANTKKDGTTLKDVNNALDELNSYADRTIYNFTQMTDSIGKFTTAGVNLDTSVAAIKGIANLAAVSGANAQQASNAMYQLSQAISSGTVKLQDWNSVVNAGLGGQVFQDSLLETARVHGVAVDNILEQEGGFRNSLQTGWLSSEILLETLEKFTGDLTEQQLKAMGYTEEQIAGIIELGETANDAATKIKTLTQFKDTLLEALQSGWATTWRIVLGDFEQAKELWGTFGDIFGEMIANSSDARNKLLEFWELYGGRAKVIQGILNLIEAATNIFGAFKEAVTDIFEPLKLVDLLRLSRYFLEFSEKIKMASTNTGNFKSIVRGIAAAFDIVRLAVGAVLKPILELIESLFPAAEGFFDTAASVGDSIVAFREFAIETGFFDNVVSNVIETVGELIDRVKEIVNEFGELEIVQDIVGYFESIERSDLVNWFNGLLDVLKVIAAPFVFIGLSLKRMYDEIVKLEIIEDLAEWFGSISWEGIKESIQGMADGVKDLFDRFKNSESVNKFLEYLSTFDGRRIAGFFGEIGDSVGSLSELLEEAKGLIDELLEKIFPSGGSGGGGDAATSGIFADLDTIVADVLDKLLEVASNIDYSGFFDLINTILLAGLLTSLKRIFKGAFEGEFLSNAIDSVIGQGSTLGDSIRGAFGSMEDVLTSMQNNIRADSLQKIAIAIAILVGSIALLTLLDQNKLVAAAAAITAITVALFGTTGSLTGISVADATKTSIAILALSGAILVAAVAMNRIAELDMNQVEAAIVGMTGALGALIISVRTLSTGDSTGLLKSAVVILALTGALKVLADVLIDLGTLDPSVLAQGLLGMAAAISGLVAATLIMGKVKESDLVGTTGAILSMSFALDILAGSVLKLGLLDPNILAQGLAAAGVALLGFAGFSRLVQPVGMISAGVAIGVLSGALIILSIAVERFGTMNYDEMVNGLIAIAGVLTVVVVAANAMTSALPGALAIVVMSGALLVMSVALAALGALTIEAIIISLAAIAGVITVLGLAAAALSVTGAIAALFALGVALLIIGAAAGLVGVGILAASVGLVALAASGAAVAGVIGVVAAAFIEILPALGEAIAQAFINFYTTIAENTPTIITAMETIIWGMIDMVLTNIPEFVAAIADMLLALLDAIVERLPEFIDRGYDILLAVIQGLVDHIQEIVDAGLNLLTEFLAGIESGMPALIEQAFSLIITFINSLAEAIDQYYPDLVDAAKNLGDAIIEGIVYAVGLGLSDVIASITGIGGAALAAIKEILGIKSPSTKFMEVGRDVIMGFVKGIKVHLVSATSAMADFGQKIQNGIKPSFSALADSINDEFAFNPVIKPVVDLSEASAAADFLSRSFAGADLAANISNARSRQAKNYDNVATQLPGADTQKCVTYQQNIYSPKEVDRASLYRSTKTLLAKKAVEKGSV